MQIGIADDESSIQMIHEVVRRSAKTEFPDFGRLKGGILEQRRLVAICVVTA